MNLRPRRRLAPKIFCVGLNKTGTTSLEHTFRVHGFRVGDQQAGEDLLEDWARRDFESVIRLSYTADAFQDAPYSFPFTYQALDMHFPNARFILTVRDDFEQWYRSLTRFHARLWTDGTRVPTADDLRQATYRYRGRPYRANRLLFDTPESDPYSRERLRRYYENHNDAVAEYFRHRPGKLLVLNLAEEGSYASFCRFLGLAPRADGFPRLNRTSA